MAISDHAPALGVGTSRALPGLLLCLLIAALAVAAEHLGILLIGRAWLDALPLAIILGIVVRSSIGLGHRFDCGVHFSSKTILEIAVVLLGASVDPKAALAAGPTLLGGIALVVTVSLPLGYAVGRLLGLNRKLALLIACGNSICGNSAIAAAAPVIGADGDDVACSIAFTAILGVLVVLALPLLVPLTGWSVTQYGVFAGLTVYAVPQVLAATAPISAASLQIGTLVKLARVLMLGPVVAVLAIVHGNQQQARPSLGHLLPWFILGFLSTAIARALGIIPEAALPTLSTVTTVLTIISMAGLGLSADIRMLAHVGGRVLAAAILSLVVIGMLSYGLLTGLGVQ